MTFTEIQQLFAQTQTWEQRYRQLIFLAKQLEKPDDKTLSNIPLIEGCESRLWFKLDGDHCIAYSDARILNGILFIIKTILAETPLEECSTLQITPLLQQLKIDQRLSETRLNGLKKIEQLIQNA
ncbi:SufE family protein [Gallibacterium anatis]|uniref:SufE family protein n=1 Tax=Gallibacterium anatis TaxID=750 RepID=UPI0039FCAB56